MKPVFSTKNIEEATGLPMNTIQSYLRREDVFAGQEDAGGARGVPRQWSLNGAVQFVLGAKLIGLGIQPEKAFPFAAKFAFFGKAHEGGNGSAVIERRPGLPFPMKLGNTWMIVADDDPVICVAPAGTFPLEMAADANAFRAVNLTALFEQMGRRMGFDAVGILRGAYEN